MRLFSFNIPRLAVSLAVVVAAVLVPPEILRAGPDLCVWQNLLGLETCPACGSTRALVAFFHGQFREALSFNLNVLVTAPTLLGLLAVDAWKAVAQGLGRLRA